MAIPEISVLLEENKFIEAEAALNELERTDRFNTSAAYLRGTLYDHYGNPSRSREKAQRHFSMAATGSPPVEEAFIELARLESNSNHAIRIVEKGISLFPKSQRLFFQLFRNNPLENRETVFLRAQEQGMASDDMRAEMVSGFVALHQFEKALKLIDTIQKQTLQHTRNLMTAVCLLELKQVEKAKEIFSRIVTDDIDHKFIFVPHFGLIACLVDAQPRSAIKLLSEIRTEVAWNSSEFAYWPFYFDYSSFVLRIINRLEKLPACRGFLPKLRGLRGLLINANPELLTVARNRVRMIKDLEYARTHLPQNAPICKALHDDRVQNGNHFEAYKLAVLYFGCAGDPNADDYGLDLDYLGTLTAEKFSEIVEDFKGRLPSERYGLHRAGGIFDAVVQRLHREKKYGSVAELAEIAGDYYSEKTGVLFEVAYAFGESRKRSKARKFYNLYLQKYSKATAALNNLALLEEHDGRLDQAESLLRKCIEIDTEDELPRNNLKRVLRLKAVVEKFQKDDLANRKLVVELWRRKGPGYEFECTLADMQNILPSASVEDAKTRLRQLVEKGYLEQKDDRNRFELSAGLRSQMSDLERTIEKEGEIAKLAGGISKENLEKIGFDDELLNSLTKIGSTQLQTLLKRDLKEAALARLTDSHKTALVMCGSIIEAVLADKIYGKSIQKYQLENGKSKNVSRMDLGDLLYVAMKESLVDDQLYHLAHALRGFRNLIHPGVEQRKKAITASESNARIAWDITRKLLLEM